MANSMFRISLTKTVLRPKLQFTFLRTKFIRTTALYFGLVHFNIWGIVELEQQRALLDEEPFRYQRHVTNPVHVSMLDFWQSSEYAYGYININSGLVSIYPLLHKKRTFRSRISSVNGSHLLKESLMENFSFCAVHRTTI